MEGLFQPTHLIIILVIILIVFGAGKLPEAGAGLGRTVREFRKGVQDPLEGDEAASGPSQPVQTGATAAPPAVDGPAVVYCPDCGGKLPTSAAFCPTCGASVKAHA